MKKTALSFHHYALIAIVLWATSYVVTKLVVDSFSAGPLALIRCFIASAVLAGVMAAKRIPSPSPRHWYMFVAPGFIGLSLYSIFFNQGTALINPSTVCIIIATAPILTAILAAFVFREKLHPLAWCAIALAFAGILIMTLWEMSVEINFGALWTALAALTLAIYNILQRGLAKSYQPLQVTTWSFFAGTFFLLWFLPQTVAQIRAAPLSDNLMALYLGLFPSAVAYLAWVKAFSLSPKTSYVSNYMFMTPVLAIAMELVVIAEYPDMATITGGLVIVASLVLFFIAGKKKT